MDLAPEDRFRSNLLTLFDIINEMFEEGIANGVIKQSINILPLIKLFIKRTDSDHMIKRFIRRTHKYWDIIKRKDDDYIKEKLLGIFNDVQENGVDAVKKDEELKGDSKLINSLSGDHFVVFKDLLSKSYEYEGEEIFVFDEERRDDIWKIMHSFVRISLCYVHFVRKWDGEKYLLPFFNEGEDELHVRKLAKEWGVKSI